MILTVLLLWAPAATAACETVCDSERDRPRSVAAEAGHEHHGPKGTHHEPSERDRDCCCISQSVASQQLELRKLTQDATGAVPVFAQPTVATETAVRAERGVGPLYARPPFGDRVQPLLI